MNQQPTNPGAQANPGANTAETGPAHERCLCYEVFDLFRSRLGVSPRVKEHLANSRIEHLSKPVQHGTRIRVE